MTTPVNSFPQQPENDLRIDTAWRENYTSQSLNRKIFGLLRKGVYQGFDVIPGAGLTVEVGSDGNNIALIDVPPFALTASMPSDVKKTLTLQAGKTQYVVLEASYAVNVESSVSLAVVDHTSENSITLAKITLPDAATNVVIDNIEIPKKPSEQEGDIKALKELLDKLLKENTQQHIDLTMLLHERLAQISPAIIDNMRRHLKLRFENDEAHVAFSKENKALKEEITKLNNALFQQKQSSK